MAAGVRKSEIARVPGKRAVRAQLDRITASPDFDTSQRSADFLRFVVTAALAGRENTISQHAIAADVFGRGDEFDPTTDPIVRMQAGRVRRSLKHYYLTAGSSDPVLIGLPKGSYVPTFEFRQTSPTAPQPTAAPAPADGDSWPTLLVSPLRNLTGRQDAEFIAQGLASDLAAELNHYADLCVFLSPYAGADSTGAGLPRWEFTGAVALRGDDFRITFHLLDRETGRQRWAHTYRCPAGSDRGVVLDRVVQAAAAMVADERGFVARHLGEESRRRPYADGNAYEAILRHHHFELTHDPQVFVEALTALRQALESNPDCALCWSYLARLGGIHWSMGLSGDAIPIEDSIAAARRGVELAPLDVRSRVVLGYVLLIADEIDQARTEADIALELSDMSIFWLDAVGHLLTLSGDWERGPGLIRRAVQINPFPRRACHCALWLDALRRDDPAAALTAARAHAPEAYFWSPLMEAVALVADDRADEAATRIESLLQIKPDFPDRAHWLITRYVKFPSLVQGIEDALSAVGLAQGHSRLACRARR